MACGRFWLEWWQQSAWHGPTAPPRPAPGGGRASGGPSVVAGLVPESRRGQRRAAGDAHWTAAPSSWWWPVAEGRSEAVAQPTPAPRQAAPAPIPTSLITGSHLGARLAHGQRLQRLQRRGLDIGVRARAAGGAQQLLNLVAAGGCAREGGWGALGSEWVHAENGAQQLLDLVTAGWPAAGMGSTRAASRPPARCCATLPRSRGRHAHSCHWRSPRLPHTRTTALPRLTS